MSKENSRWTYTLGSRPEGVIVYDDDTKLHSHHDTDPARGQHSAFDLVRLHKFGHLDSTSTEAPITGRPSYLAMVEFAASCPEIRTQRATTEFEDCSDLPTTGIQVDAAVQTRFLVQSAADFSGGKPMEWIVRGLLPRAELAVIYGESGSGKSFLALDICAAIARGIAWRDKKVAKGRIVYVCAEGAGGFKARLRAYAQSTGTDMGTLPGVIADAPNLLEPKDAAAITHAIVTWGEVDVVVIDTLSATTPGGNENSGEDIGLVISHCKLIHRKTGALVVLIHHSGKDAARGARGWSGLRAAADAEIEITRNGDFRNASITKLKDGSDSESFGFKLKVVPLGFDSDGEEETSCVIEHVENAPEAHGDRQRPVGRYQLAMYDVLKTVAPSGTVDYEDLINGYMAKMPCGDGKDNRRRDAKRAIEDLITKKLAFMHPLDRVSLTSLITSADEGWLL